MYGKLSSSVPFISFYDSWNLTVSVVTSTLPYSYAHILECVGILVSHTFTNMNLMYVEFSSTSVQLEFYFVLKWKIDEVMRKTIIEQIPVWCLYSLVISRGYLQVYHINVKFSKWDRWNYANENDWILECDSGSHLYRGDI